MQHAAWCGHRHAPFHTVPRVEVTARQILGAQERAEGELAKLGRSRGALLGLKHLVPSTGGVQSDVMATAGIAKAWWAHVEFTRINTEPIILKNKIEDFRVLDACGVAPRVMLGA
jgi:hypothetical protein